MDYLPLEDCLQTLIDYRGKTPKKTVSGIRLITAKVIKNGTITDNSFEYIAENEYDSWMRRGLPIKGDVLLTTEAPLGEVAQIRSSQKIALAQRVILLRANPDILDRDYLLFAMQSRFVQGELNARATGTTVEGIKQSELRKVLIPILPIEAQREIGAILYNYDSLIENNKRRIAILEDIAQTLYREWFVNFRYPNRKDNVDAEGKPKLIDSPLGQLPVGWKMKPLGELVEFKRKTVKKGRVPEQTPYMGLEHFPRKSIALSDWEAVSEIGSDKLVFSRGDILFGKIRPNFHKVGVAQVDGLCSSDTFVLSPKEPAHHSLIAMVTFSNEFVSQAVQTAQGSKMPRASWDVLQEFAVCLPDANAIEQFNNLVTPAIEQIRVLGLKNRNLKQQRDMLLPKLISGQIEL